MSEPKICLCLRTVAYSVNDFIKLCDRGLQGYERNMEQSTACCPNPWEDVCMCESERERDHVQCNLSERQV